MLATDQAQFKCLRWAIQESWSPFTTRDRLWTPRNKALGQCAASSCVLQDYFGGDIVYARAELPDGCREGHFYNCIGGQKIDLTESQFPEGTVVNEAELAIKASTMRGHILAVPERRTNYQLLAESVRLELAELYREQARHARAATIAT